MENSTVSQTPETLLKSGFSDLRVLILHDLFPPLDFHTETWWVELQKIFFHDVTYK